MSNILSVFFPNKTVTNNIELMLSNEDGGMANLIKNESFWGNAKNFSGYSCVGANFKYFPDTGSIIYFENIQHTPGYLKSLPTGIFQVAINKESWKLSIVNIYASGWMDKLALNVLEKTVKQYNKKNGFRINDHTARVFRLNSYSKISTRDFVWI